MFQKSIVCLKEMRHVVKNYSGTFRRNWSLKLCKNTNIFNYAHFLFTYKVSVSRNLARVV